MRPLVPLPEGENVSSVKAFLQNDELTNTDLLWLLRGGWLGFSGNRRVFVDNPDQPGVVFIFHDSGNRACWEVEAASPCALARALPFPRGKDPFQLRLHRPWMVDLFQPHFELELQHVNLRFQVTRESFRPRFSPEVVCLDPAHENALRAHRSGWAEKDWFPAVLEEAESVWGIVREGQWISLTFVERVSEHCSEVFGVWTDESYRRQGGAAAVVSAATGSILEAGRTALYRTGEDNVGSLRLAESLGFLQHATRSFFRVQPK